MRAIFWTIDRLGIRFRDPEFRIERTQFNALSSLIERLSVGNARSRDSILGTLSTFDRAKDMTTYLTEWGSPDEHTKSKAERKAKGARQQDED
jgi:hypothetical protein